ncbi:MAG: RtcB family protein [Bacteroidales bacterium]
MAKIMKKLKLRARELKRLGYTDKQAIELAASIVARHFQRENKKEALERLATVNKKAGEFVDDAVFGKLAQRLTRSRAEKQKPAKNPMPPRREHYAVYGPEFIDQETFQQMDTAIALPISVKGALMADAHVGYGLPIGGVLATYNAVIPYGVGMDIGCRMCMSVYGLSASFLDKKRERLRNILVEQTRFGHAEFNDIRDHEILERKELNGIKFLRSLKPKLHAQLGTSGHGNHFVDLGLVEFGEAFGNVPAGTYMAVLSHSGSRNFGAEVARHYTKIAKQKLGLDGASANLAWLELDSEEGQEYWQAMTLAGDFSAANHHIIHDKISGALGEAPLCRIENHHNYAWKEKLPESGELIIHRKGATPAGKGSLGIIPGNMVSPAYIVEGKGNERSLNSASHGAGRRLSRRQAKKRIARNSLDATLKAHDVELIGGATDESPDAYKDIVQVMEAQKELVEIRGIFHPKIVRMA